MKITSAVFQRAAQSKKDYPPGNLVEIAFAGRSNVGKSSAINSLLGRKNLVKISKTPGHTRKLNFFLINDSFIFVDFPGYGFARVPLDVKREWSILTDEYISDRRQLAGVVALVDVRHAPTESDLVLIDYLKHKNIPIIIAATKSDKLSRSELRYAMERIAEELGPEIPLIPFSATAGLGKNELWREIIHLIELRRPAMGPSKFVIKENI